MKIAVIGAGAIGGTLAALLDRAGHSVEVTARGERLAAIRAGGLRLTGRWGEHRAHVAAGERLTAAPDLALLCVKAQDERAALRANEAALAGVPLVVVQNGLDGAAGARGVHTGPAIGAIAFFSADCPVPGEARVLVPGPLYLGSGSAPPSAEADAAARVLSTAIQTRAVANFAGCQWTKLVVNQINAMPAITGLSVQETLAEPGLRRIILASMREALRTGRREGVTFGSLEGMTPLALGILRSAPAPVAGALLRIMGRRLGREPVLGSTLQSVQRGLPTEIDHLNGAIVARARALGADAPVNAAMTALVHEVEIDHRFRTPHEVIRRIRLP
ncbi:2-dehydropantoate 2-reductase [Sinomonas atrocyanea]|uniref:ketopantoate reductase family protein n=1 Tax=Sinomonas atrocyanea TaxID=37927 RepID=UPI00278481D0|nr:2-dehydropantoate 2-reductase [Sinomonas atrocyanea]MDP9884671.1 2-dehydropantoate 2-reductase [Sinomonas atrocyanea]